MLNRFLDTCLLCVIVCLVFETVSLIVTFLLVSLIVALLLVSNDLCLERCVDSDTRIEHRPYNSSAVVHCPSNQVKYNQPQ